jgi:hypothetical protein
MTRRLCAVAFLLAFLPPLTADETADLLAEIKRVAPQGANSPAARAAWDKLVKKGPAVLPAVLAAMDTTDTVAANWLRTAFDRIADEAVGKGGKAIDADALLRFAEDEKHQGRARRLALDLVEQLRPGTRVKFLAGRTGDDEFRHDAIEQALDRLGDTDLPKDKRTERLRALFAATRDLSQSRLVATRLRDLGAEVSVADHFGFLRDWYAIGPFDAGGMKGFRTVYPPEEKIDLGAKYEGKDKKALAWKRFTAPETRTGNHVALVDLRAPLGDAEDAVAYAYTAFESSEVREVEFRGAADDNLSVWVNGVRVFGFEEYRNGVRFDRHRFTLRLKAGVNTVLVKVCQAPSDPSNREPNWEFLLRVCDAGGKGLSFKSALPAVK